MTLLSDGRYFALVRTLTKLDLNQCPFSSPRDRRTWVENQVQVALCEADVYPASSADCKPDHPSFLMRGEEPSADLIAEVELMLAGH